MATTPRKVINIALTPTSVIKAILVLAVTYGLWQIKGVILMILTSVVIAAFVHAGTKGFARAGIPRSVAVVLIYVLGFGLLGLVLWVFLPVFFDELIAISQLLPDGSALSNIFSVLNTPDGIKGVVSTFSNGDNPFMLADTIRGQLSAVNLFQGVSAIFGGIVNFILMIVISFYLSMEETGTEQFLRLIVPRKHENRVVEIWHRSRIKIGSWFKGQLLLALILATLTYIGLLIIGVPYALMLSLVAALLGLIPFGIVLGTVPALVVGFLAGGFSMVAFVLILYIGLQQLENHVLQPLIIGRVTGVPSLVVLLSVVIGVKLLGFLGLVLAIPISVVILEIIHDFEERRAKLLAKKAKAAS